MQLEGITETLKKQYTNTKVNKMEINGNKLIYRTSQKFGFTCLY